MKKTLAAVLLGLSLTSAPAAAATLITDTNGQLTGASGVNVDGTLYDVVFGPGSCADNFGTCDSTTIFQFATQTAAEAAARALLAQVFINDGTLLVDDIPTLTFGCTSAFVCQALIPYAADDSFNSNVTARNFPAANEVRDGVGSIRLSNSFSTTVGSTAPSVYASFTPASAVPEPTTWLMLILGLFGVGSALRGQSRSGPSRSAAA